jgi:hypothetical protein
MVCHDVQLLELQGKQSGSFARAERPAQYRYLQYKGYIQGVNANDTADRTYIGPGRHGVEVIVVAWPSIVMYTQSTTAWYSSPYPG